MCAALRLRVLALRQPGTFHLPVYRNFFAGTDWADYRGLYLTDDLAVLGTNVEEISQLLNAEELNHKDTPVKLADTGISLRSVSFSYDGTTEVLHDVSLTIRPGTMTALVGPSGSGKSTVAKLIAGIGMLHPAALPSEVMN